MLKLCVIEICVTIKQYIYAQTVFYQMISTKKILRALDNMVVILFSDFVLKLYDELIIIVFGHELNSESLHDHDHGGIRAQRRTL